MTSWLPIVAWSAPVGVFAGLADVWNGHEPGWCAALERPFLQPD